MQKSLCFGTHFGTWDRAGAIVANVEGPNFGMWLDTNVTGRELAESLTRTAKGSRSEHRARAEFGDAQAKGSVQYIQDVVAERLRELLRFSHAVLVNG